MNFLVFGLEIGKAFTCLRGKYVISTREKGKYGWDEILIPENKVFQNQEQPVRDGISENKSLRRCTGCNQPLGIVSSILYEVDEKPYCSACYSKIISNKAVARDHSDIIQEYKNLK